MIWARRALLASPLLALAGIGVWPAAELVFAFVLALCAIFAFSAREFSLLPLLLAGLTAAMLFFVDFPLRSWLGHPAICIGGAWWLCLAIMGGLEQERWLVTGAALCLAVLQWTVGLEAFPDYLAFAALASILCNKHPLALALAGLVLLASCNLTALLAFPICFLAALFLPRWSRFAQPLLLASCAACLVEVGLVPSLQSRAALWESTADTVAGWGMVNNTMRWQVPEGPVLKWAFHSHNGFLETGLALGLAGLLLYSALWAWAALHSKGRVDLAVWSCWAVTAICWFELPLVLPFFGAALSCGPKVRLSPLLGPVLTGVLAASSALVASGAISSTILLRQTQSQVLTGLFPIFEPLSGSPRLGWLLGSAKERKDFFYSADLTFLGLEARRHRNADKRLSENLPK